MNEYLSHKSIERKDHKYFARVPLKSVGGKQTYKYFYSQAEYQAYMKGAKGADVKKVQTEPIPENKTTKTSSKNPLTLIRKRVKSASDKTKNSVDGFLDGLALGVKKEVAKTPERLNKVVDKAKEIGGKFYDNKDNMYDVTSQSYEKKMKQIAESPEWKAIVERKDPEYVKKNSDGSMDYLIDDYVAKKKMPLMDIVDDITSNRPITVNKIEKDALVSGVKEHIYSTVAIGVLAAKTVSTALIERSKMRSGTYDDEIEYAKEKLESGKDYVKKTIEDSKETAQNVSDSISEDDIKDLVKLLQDSQKAVTETAKKAANSVDEAKVQKAAKLLMSSGEDASDDYMEVLSSLSDEEMVLLNILMTAARKG